MARTEIFQFGEAAKITGVAGTQLRNWLKGRTIEIVPSVRSSSGRGFISLFSRDDLYKITFARALLGAGQSGETVQKALKSASQHLMRDEVLVVNFTLEGSELKWVNSLNEAPKIRTLAQFILDGAELRKEVDQAIESYKER